MSDGVHGRGVYTNNVYHKKWFTCKDTKKLYRKYR